MMHCSSNFDKCADVIQRLSSRIKSEQNQSTTIPSCIEKTFYQCKGSVGQNRCVEMRGNGCNPAINEQNCGPSDFHRNQFALSNIFDNKRRYIDYVVSNVLRQVVNQVSLESLHRLSCCLPQQIEDALCNVTDIDSDRLVRILVTEVLQCYGNNVGQVTDWYAFANSIQTSSLTPAPLTMTDDENRNAVDTRNQPPAKPKKRSTEKDNSSRVLSNQVKSIFDTEPNSPSGVRKKESSASAAFDHLDTPVANANLPSTDRTPLRTQSKETYTPIGSRYQSKGRPPRTLVSDKPKEVGTIPFDENEKQPIPRHARPRHHDRHSSKSSDRSSSSDCVLTIHHTHKHKKNANRRHHHHDHHTTSFDAVSSRSLASYTSVPKNQQISLNAAANLIRDMSLNSTKRELLTPLNREDEYHQATENLSFPLSMQDDGDSSADDEQGPSVRVNEPQVQASVLIDNDPSSSSDEYDQQPESEKFPRINHYPNMLADFD